MPLAADSASARTKVRSVGAASVARDTATPTLWPLSTFRGGADGAGKPGEIETQIAGWIRSYLMQPHPELGRTGAVCPFTPHAAKLDAVLIGTSRRADVEGIVAVMERAISAFDVIEVPREARRFRAVLVGFPECSGADGAALLRAAQNRLRPHSIYRGKMIGLFEPNSQAAGLINPDFKPLRAPLPLLAIRSLVVEDAPFVKRNPRLAPLYLLKFGRDGLRRLFGKARP